MNEIKITDESGDRKYFTIVPNYILNNSDAVTQALYIQLKKLAGEGGETYCSRNYLMDKLKISKPTLLKKIEFLLGKGWIEDAGEKIIETEGGNQVVKSYRISDIWELNNTSFKGGKENQRENVKGGKKYYPPMPKGGKKYTHKEEPVIQIQDPKEKKDEILTEVRLSSSSKVSQENSVITFDDWLITNNYTTTEYYSGEDGGMVEGYKHKARKMPYTRSELEKRYLAHIRGQSPRNEAYRSLQRVSGVWSYFVKRCKQELGKEPLPNAKSRGIIKFALDRVGDNEIEKVIDEWFTLGLPDEETIQITRALSGHQLNSYIARK